MTLTTDFTGEPPDEYSTLTNTTAEATFWLVLLRLFQLAPLLLILTLFLLET